MTVKTMENIFVETLKDIYYAEKQILKALPGMVKKAGSPETQRGAQDTPAGDRRTGGPARPGLQAVRCCRRAARSARRSKASSPEAKEHMEDIEDAKVLDAGMIGSAQAVEHYEITPIRDPHSLGEADWVGTRLSGCSEENLEQEKHADKLLTEIAESAVNRRAAA